MTAAAVSCAAGEPFRLSATSSSTAPHATSTPWLSSDAHRCQMAREAASCDAAEPSRIRRSRGGTPPAARMALCIALSPYARSASARAASSRASTTSRCCACCCCAASVREGLAALAMACQRFCDGLPLSATRSLSVTACWARCCCCFSTFWASAAFSVARALTMAAIATLCTSRNELVSPFNTSTLSLEPTMDEIRSHMRRARPLFGMAQSIMISRSMPPHARMSCRRAAPGFAPLAASTDASMTLTPPSLAHSASSRASCDSARAATSGVPATWLPSRCTSAWIEPSAPKAMASRCAGTEPMSASADAACCCAAWLPIEISFVSGAMPPATATACAENVVRREMTTAPTSTRWGCSDESRCTSGATPPAASIASTPSSVAARWKSVRAA